MYMYKKHEIKKGTKKDPKTLHNLIKRVLL